MNGFHSTSGQRASASLARAQHVYDNMEPPDDFERECEECGGAFLPDNDDELCEECKPREYTEEEMAELLVECLDAQTKYPAYTGSVTVVSNSLDKELRAKILKVKQVYEPLISK